MTIDLLDVSMQGVFAYGQAYVALSRAVSLDRVRVRAFTPACVRAHPIVKAYYKWMSEGGKGGIFKWEEGEQGAVNPMQRFNPSAPVSRGASRAYGGTSSAGGSSSFAGGYKQW